jgi:hypothetical protein
MADEKAASPAARGIASRLSFVTTAISTCVVT